MNSLNLTCALLLTTTLTVSIFAASLKLLFTSEELTEMGIRLGPSES